MASTSRRATYTTSLKYLRTYFFVFEALNAVLLALDACSLQRVVPILNTVFAGLVQSSTVLIPHGDVGLHVRFGDLVLDTLEFVEGDHD